MHEIQGRFTTGNGAKYLRQLCTHFGHKIEVECSGNTGICHFEMGKAFLTADDKGLTVRFELEDASNIPHAHSVIDSHLVNFAFREGFEAMDWQA